MKEKCVYSLLLIICVLLPFLFVGCDIHSISEPSTHTFRQEYSNVEKVEICAYDHYNQTQETLAELSDSEIHSLWQDILCLESSEFIMLDPILSYGDVVIFIHYLDGEIEVIGITNIGWISPDGKLTTTTKYFDISAICSVIAKYVDAQTLAESSEYF